MGFAHVITVVGSLYEQLESHLLLVTHNSCPSHHTVSSLQWSLGLRRRGLTQGLCLVICARVLCILTSCVACISKMQSPHTGNESISNHTDNLRLLSYFPTISRVLHSAVLGFSVHCIFKLIIAALYKVLVVHTSM